jgi:hypothetical protein
MPQTQADIQLTAREVLSLSAIGILRSSRKTFWQSLGRPLSLAWKTFLLRTRLLDARNERIPMLEGKTLRRWDQDQNVLFAVGERESLSHLPGVGTILVTPDGMTTKRTHTTGFLLARLFRRGTRFPRSQTYLPLPPLPLEMQRWCIKKTTPQHSTHDPLAPQPSREFV